MKIDIFTIDLNVDIIIDLDIHTDVIANFFPFNVIDN